MQTKPYSTMPCKILSECFITKVIQLLMRTPRLIVAKSFLSCTTAMLQHSMPPRGGKKQHEFSDYHHTAAACGRLRCGVDRGSGWHPAERGNGALGHVR